MSQANAPPHELKRILTRRDLILYGLVLLGPTAAYPVYGIVQQTSHGHAVLAYLVAMTAMLFTAASYGKMSSAYPSAGSTYTYTNRALNTQVGFLAGWAMLLDYFLIPLLSVVYAALTANRTVPQVPYAAWAILFTVAITLINVRGLRVTARAGNVMMALMCACAVLFVFLAAWHTISQHGWAGLVQFRNVYNPAEFAVKPLVLGAAIASLSYIGFDAISALAEDTIRPERDISIATILVCVVQTLLCVLTVYMAALVWPDFQSYKDPETVILDIGALAGGPWMLGFMTFILLVAALASALTGQAGASRLLLGMGRDGVISPRIFAHIDPRYSTPVRGIYFMGAVSLLGSLVLRFQLVVELLNFGAFAGFILVNLSVIRHFYLRQHQRAGLAVLGSLVFPLLGAGFCTYIWLNLSAKAQLAGFGWLGCGLIYLAILTRGFRLTPRSMDSLAAGDLS
ncbi:APC family permease [Paludibaculum fermentans]|uniref:APC family permease n=1 Tax=Paludibaculum fermentans TaxID=1473598 RepID=A0A7S7NLA2_PALFE|nr:APC family permease [Paludibaculum fermentans]QOY85635.1 APC family permease [Paludibaculum fermentans]